MIICSHIHNTLCQGQINDQKLFNWKHRGTSKKKLRRSQHYWNCKRFSFEIKIQSVIRIFVECYLLSNFQTIIICDVNPCHVKLIISKCFTFFILYRVFYTAIEMDAMINSGFQSTTPSSIFVYTFNYTQMTPIHLTHV